MKLPCVRCHRVLVDSAPVCSGCAAGATCGHGKVVGTPCDYCGTARLAPRPEDSLAIKLPDGTRIVQYGDGAMAVEAGASGFSIEAGIAEEDAHVLSQMVTCDGCGEDVVARSEEWTRCACGTQTMELR